MSTNEKLTDASKTSRTVLKFGVIDIYIICMDLKTDRGHHDAL